MVILHDAIKTIQNGVFPFIFKKGQTSVSLTKMFLTQKKQVGCFLFKKRVFLYPDVCLSQESQTQIALRAK